MYYRLAKGRWVYLVEKKIPILEFLGDIKSRCIQFTQSLSCRTISFSYPHELVKRNQHSDLIHFYLHNLEFLKQCCKNNAVSRKNKIIPSFSIFGKNTDIYL